MSPIPSRNEGATDNKLRLSLFLFIYTPSFVLPPLVTSQRIQEGERQCRFFCGLITLLDCERKSTGSSHCALHAFLLRSWIDDYFAHAPVSFLRTAVDARIDGDPRRFPLVDSIRRTTLVAKLRVGDLASGNAHHARRRRIGSSYE